jgi:hypothetical protein
MACFGGELVVSPSNWWEVFSRLNESTFGITGDWNLFGRKFRTVRPYSFSLSLAA